MDTPAEDRQLNIDDKRVIDQLNHLVPQIHLTLASVLQGLALVFLITALKAPRSLDPHDLLAAILANNGYLPLIFSFMFLIITWNEFAYAVFFLHWPLTSVSTALQFLLTVAEIAMFSSINSVGRWLFWGGLAGIIGAVILRRNQRIVSPTLYRVPNGAGNLDLYRKWIVNANAAWDYYILGFLCMGLGIARDMHAPYLDYAIVVGDHHVGIFDMVVPLVLCIAGLIMMRSNDSFFVKFIDDILQSHQSPYRLMASGKIEEQQVVSRDRDVDTPAGDIAASQTTGGAQLRPVLPAAELNQAR